MATKNTNGALKRMGAYKFKMASITTNSDRH